MKAWTKNIISVFFISIFLVKGVAVVMYPPGMFNKISVTTERGSENEETEKNASEKESILYCERSTIEYYIPYKVAKVTIVTNTSSWSNISLPVFTPPPESV